MKIVVTGANGQVGWELARSLLPLGDVFALDRKQADLSDPSSLIESISALKPDVIVNAAAYTAVDKAEEEESLATTINGVSPGELAKFAKKNGALLIHYSTDYVFDGEKPTPYTEEDIPNPINAYGRSKLAGEQAIQSEGEDYLILRTTWVYAARGKNFVKTMLRLGQEREDLKIVSDQYGAPTWARNIADATAQIISIAQRERQTKTFASGIFNLSASGETTWYGFASEIFSNAALLISSKYGHVNLNPIFTSEYQVAAERPKNSCLNNKNLKNRFGICIPSWDVSLRICLHDILEMK